MPTNEDLAKRLRAYPKPLLSDDPKLFEHIITHLERTAALEATPTLEQVFACVRRDVRPGPVREVLMGEIAALYAQPVTPPQPAGDDVEERWPTSPGEWVHAGLRCRFSDNGRGKMLLHAVWIGPDDNGFWGHPMDGHHTLRGWRRIATTDPVAAGVEWTAEPLKAGLADIAAQRPKLDGDKVHEAMWGIIFEERRKVAQLAAELKEERDDREKYAGVYAEMNVALGNKLADLKGRLADRDALWDHCGTFIAAQRISCPESVYQTDHVIANAYEFIEGVGQIVGWYTPSSGSAAEE